MAFVTRSERIRHYSKIEKNIENRLESILPTLGFPMEHFSWEISCPHEYMGRIDQGKAHWTLDIRPYSYYIKMRTKQVRLKVDETTGDFDIDLSKVKNALEQVNKAVLLYIEEQNKKAEAEEIIPENLPSEINVVANKFGEYEIQFKTRTFEPDKMKKIVNDLLKIKK